MGKGRPRAFDVDEALDKALHVFWEKGYEGASLPVLTEAMGINRPSLYAAFGNKEALFRKVIDRYIAGPAAYYRDALMAPTGRAAVEQLLRGAATLLTESGNPHGCLMVQAALCCSESADPVRRELATRRQEGEAAIRKRLKKAVADGDLRADANPADLARYFATVMHGMAVEATGGATKRELLRTVDLALQAWPQ